MTEEKKSDKKRQTKAGMLEKNSKRTSTRKSKADSAKDTENTPKISKEKAEKDTGDKPIH
ncbi:MAG: hypothetical protein M3384_14910 [Acidobacteriota bacterium]|nr:hypothetical protein [Acidobacteriota bacterium]